MSMLIHTYLHKPLRKVKCPSTTTRLTAHFMCGLMPDLVFASIGKEYVMDDSECPYGDEVSLNNTNSYKYLCMVCDVFSTRR